MDIWHELRIERTTDRRAIKRAYSARLKEVHPEDDPAGFQRLRDAYERALAHVDGMQRGEPIPMVDMPVVASQPKPAAPKVPFLARSVAHRRANRKGPTPIIATDVPPRAPPDRVVQPPKERPKLERFRRDFLNNTWPDERRRMVGMLLLPFDLDVLEEQRRSLSTWARVGSIEDFSSLVDELRTEYSASLEELGIDPRTVDYWTREPDVEHSKDLWRGSLIISAAVTVVLMLALSVMRHFGVMSQGHYAWWVESAWILGVIATALRAWLSQRRRFYALVCMTLLIPPFVVVPEPHPFQTWLGWGALLAATSLPRATTYLVMGLAAEVYVVPIVWLGEALRWVFRVPARPDPDNELQAMFKPALVWLVLLSTFAGLVYDEPENWTRVVFVTLWLIGAEGFATYVRSGALVR